MGEFGALSCPHCGSEATGYKSSMDEIDGGSAGCCFSCRAQGPWIKCENIDEQIVQAIKAWNRRSFTKEPVMSLKVEFEFEPRDMVKTPLGDEGIVTMAGVPMDHPEPQYFVKTKTGGAWWTKDQLCGLKTEDG